MKAVLSKNELAKLEALRQYKILDTEPEEAFDALARLAAHICGTPIALINLVDANRQWFKAKVGLDVTEVSHYIGLCHLTIEQSDVVIIPDTLADERSTANPVVTSYPYVRFYAGAPLITPEGYAIGALCVFDHVPRQLSSEQVEALRTVSRQVVSQLELRRKLADLTSTTTECKCAEARGQVTAQKERLVPAVSTNAQGRETSSKRTSEQIKAEIEEKFGFVPPFFGQAEQYPQVLENLWQQTLSAYVNNPLSPLFKEKLSAYLSRYCAVPYCMICHSCSLRSLGMQAREVLELLESPPPTEEDIDEHLRFLAQKPGMLTVLPESNSELEESLLYCSIFISLEHDQAEYCRNELRRILGSSTYAHLVTFIAYVKTCHVWMEAHPEVAYEADKRVQDNLSALIEDEPSLADFFRNYWERVRRERQSRAEKLAAIAERKQAQQKIREQAALLDVATDAILVRDLENQILFWNKGAERLYGFKALDALGKNANELLFKEASPQLEQAQKTIAQKGEWHGELHQVTKQGKEIIVSSSWTLVRDDEEKPKSILIVNTDITEKKQLEAQFLRAQRMESIGTLASGIAHDLNNVLAPILMSAQLLQMKVSDERSQRLLNTMETNAKRGAALVKQVLSFARGVEGKRTILQVRHLISEIKHISQETFPKSIEFYTDIAPNLWSVSGDATQLHQVLMNLCVNARDAMPDGGTLRICAENQFIDKNYATMHLNAKLGSYIVITVSDTGTGIPPEIVDRIFEPFFTTKELGKGTGLGLSTVIGIIKGHDGFVNLYTEVGRGTQFKVYLPAVETMETLAAQDKELPTGNGELLLVVDDEADIREIAKTSLETYNYKVLTASDGIEAIALYAQHKNEINAVLMDMMMPVMDGPTTTRMLQKINPQVKIIAVSGLTSSDKVAAATSAGVKAFLSKPYTAQELLKTIKEIKENSHPFQAIEMSSKTAVST